MNRDVRKVFVAGHRGMVGSAIVRALREQRVNVVTRPREELDLLDARAVDAYLQSERPDEVYLAAARVGGIHANNSFPADFIYENLTVQSNVIHSAFRAGVKKLLFLGSSCIYPRLAPQPIKESYLLTGPLEATNEPYAVAKIAGIKMCESYNRQFFESHGVDYRSVMPTNLYGPGDNYHSENSHVIPALLRRFHEAKTRSDTDVTIWGTGTPMREFLFVEDLASACLFVMGLDRSALNAVTRPMLSHLNVGSGQEVTILELATLVARVTEYRGGISFDAEKPDGTPRKLLDSTVLGSLGWRPAVGLEEGLVRTYEDFCKSNDIRKGT